MIVGIVGHAADKFTPKGEASAKEAIRYLLLDSDGVASGGCHLGGVDIWAEEIADELKLPKYIFLPKERSWAGGYKQRNEEIAAESDAVYSIVVDKLPPDYSGMRFKTCYHCQRDDHIKSGGCWTVKQAKKLGKHTEVVVIKNDS